MAMTKLDKNQTELKKTLLSLNRVGAEKILKKLKKQTSILQIVEDVFIPVIEDIGTGWENGEYALSQVYWSSLYFGDWVEQQINLGFAAKSKHPKMAIAVLEDYHGLGKKMVHSIMQGSGFDLIDFGIGISVDDLVQKTMDEQIEILLISTLMLPSVLRISEVSDKLTNEGHRVKMIVGGAPFRFDSELWKKTGAEFMVRNAGEVVAAVNGLIEKHFG